MGSDAHVTVVIPARLASERLPKKVLLSETGKPLIAHVIERAQTAACVDRIVVAVDSEEIAQALLPYGAETILTAESHPNGTSRLAEAVELLELPPDEIVLNIQGDEPEIEQEVIEEAVAALRRDDGVVVGTVGSPIQPSSLDVSNPNVVKVVRSLANRALYFSRSTIPFDRQAEANPVILKHIGVYAYRAKFLAEYVSLQPTPLEQRERLEQLRVLEHGFGIGVGVAQSVCPGIDTRAQYDAFVARYSENTRD